jgi:hypothetical protein
MACPTLALDAKRAIVLDGGVLLFHAAHVGESRAFPEPLVQVGQLRRRADRVDLYPAIVQIPCEAGETQLRRRPLDKIPVANPLHPAADEIALR